ncbi:MAG: helix-turn-helix transcriptional regulator [Simplicispira sp.]|nr:helix-turn-helix transcriptional regulator [Simplicispira sp.]
MVDVITATVKSQRSESTVFEMKKATFSRSILQSKPKWKDVEYRHAYMESAVHQTIAWQIRINREHRNLTQQDLAKSIGTRQSAISRAEDTEYGNHNLGTLIKIAHALDCALVVNFVSYSELAYQSNRLSKNHLIACGFQEELRNDTNLQVNQNDPAAHALC